MRTSLRALLLGALLCLAPGSWVRAEDGTEIPTSAPILKGSVALQPGQYQYYQPKVDLDIMASPRLVGHLEASGGSGNDIEVFAFTQTQFTNWKNNHGTESLYSSGRVTAADLDVALEQAGTYVLVISNVFSTVTPKTVEGDIELRWELSEAVQSAVASSDNASMLVLGLIVVAIILVGVAIGMWVAKRNGKQVPS